MNNLVDCCKIEVKQCKFGFGVFAKDDMSSVLQPF